MLAALRPSPCSLRLLPHAARLRPLRPCMRSFSMTPTARSFLDTTAAVLTTLQTASGLPWHTLIPASTILLRLCTTTPLTLIARSRTELILKLQPVITARTRLLANRIRRSSATPAEWERQLRTQARGVRKEVWKRWRVRSWMALLPLAQVPVWVAASFTLRKVTGGDSLLPRFAASGAGGEKGEAPAVGEVEAPAVGAEGTGAAEGLLSGTLDGRGFGMETGGFSWCLDLTAADPTMLTSGVFALALFANLEGLSRGLQALALAAFPITAGYPAALTLYWAVSAIFSLAQNIVLQSLRPLPPIVKPVEPAKGVLIEGAGLEGMATGAGGGRK